MGPTRIKIRIQIPGFSSNTSARPALCRKERASLENDGGRVQINEAARATTAWTSPHPESVLVSCTSHRSVCTNNSRDADCPRRGQLQRTATTATSTTTEVTKKCCSTSATAPASPATGHAGNQIWQRTEYSTFSRRKRSARSGGKPFQGHSRSTTRRP